MKFLSLILISTFVVGVSGCAGPGYVSYYDGYYGGPYYDSFYPDGGLFLYGDGGRYSGWHGGGHSGFWGYHGGGVHHR